MSGLPVHHQLQFTQTHVRRVSDTIQPVHPKGDQSCMFIGSTNDEAETPILWPPDADSFEKTLMLGKIEGWRKRG